MSAEDKTKLDTIITISKLTNEDLNTIKTEGTYAAYGNHSCTNTPLDSSIVQKKYGFTLIVRKYSINTYQTFITFDGNIYSRRCNNTQWTNWELAITEATTSNSGLMSAEDKIKLNSITLATTTSDGLMSSDDKTKLDNFAVRGYGSDLTDAEILTWFDDFNSEWSIKSKLVNKLSMLTIRDSTSDHLYLYRFGGYMSEVTYEDTVAHVSKKLPGFYFIANVLNSSDIYIDNLRTSVLIFLKDTNNQIIKYDF